ncbi:MAG: DDE-type integrase/transposase/recombinase [Edaphobacter sp.]
MSQTSAGFLQPLRVTAAMDTVQIDLFGPLPQTPRGNTIALVMVDVFTRYVLVASLPNSRAEAVADAFLSRWCLFLAMGFPRVVQTDHGTQFRAAFFDQMLKRMGIVHRLITPFHPEAQGAVERVNRPLGDALAILTRDHHTDWDQYTDFFLPQPQHYSKRIDWGHRSLSRVRR